MIAESTQQLALNLIVKGFTFFYVLFVDNATAIPPDSNHNFSVGLIAFCDAAVGFTSTDEPPFLFVLL